MDRCMLYSRPCWVGLILVLPIGCGRATYPVEGKVVIQGENLPPGALQGYEVSLQAVGKPVGAHGQIKEDGSFTVGTHEANDGAIPGKHRVVITPPVGPGGDSPRPKSILDPKYESFNTSGLEVEVLAQRNEVTFTVQRRKK